MVATHDRRKYVLSQKLLVPQFRKNEQMAKQTKVALFYVGLLVRATGSIARCADSEVKLPITMPRNGLSVCSPHGALLRSRASSGLQWLCGRLPRLLPLAVDPSCQFSQTVDHAVPAEHACD